MKKICICCGEEKDIDEFDKIRKSKDGHRNQCKDCMKKMKKIRYENLSDEEKEKMKLKKRENNKKYWKNNINNPEFKLKEKIRRRKIHLNRLESDPLYKLRIAYKRRLNKCVKRLNIKKVYLDKLGCSLEEFKIYLEGKFEPWMNWDNYGKYNGELNYGWDLDHIIPISSAKTEEEFHKLCHYTNIQPLCSKINRDIKKDKIRNAPQH